MGREGAGHCAASDKTGMPSQCKAQTSAVVRQRALATTSNRPGFSAEELYSLLTELL